MLVFAPREIITVVFGKPYENGDLPMVILATGQLINAGTGAVGLLLTMTGHQIRWLAISISAFFHNGMLNWMLIPKLGLVGAAMATMVTVGTLFITALVQVRSLLGLWPYDARYTKGIIAATASVFALCVFRIALLDSIKGELLWVITAVMIAIGVFAGSLYLLRLDREDKEFLLLLRTNSVRLKEDR